MAFKPLERMWERIEVARSDSDTALFHDLMYLGEMMAKVIVASMVAAVEDDKDRSRYRVVAELVRADGIGDWSKALAEVLSGPPSQHLSISAREAHREFTHKFASGSWQYDAALKLHSCLALLDPAIEAFPLKVDGLRWIRDFARLRNKTRGHGAPRSDVLIKLTPLLEASMHLVDSNTPIFRREWAVLHRNLSGKYRVTRLSESDSSFDRLKQTTSESLPNGVYICWDRPVRVELTHADIDAADFHIANGGFSDKRFELLSYVSGGTIFADSTPFLSPSTALPGSETDGSTELQLLGSCLANLPPAPTEYVSRTILEEELTRVLSGDRHPVITLVGRGGIGKTSLALHVLHRAARDGVFDAVVWFSARDLDLLPQGPKQVRPSVLSVKDLADEFVRLVAPGQAKEKGFKSHDFLAEALGKPILGSTLFVFDNFETIINPSEVFRWIDTYVRLPNKVVVTTRHRDFKGDYPIDVRGMSDAECEVLVDTTAARLGITQLLTSEYRRELIRESEGHPYVVKILLGEVSKAMRLKKVERIVADAEEILVALFERTFALLSPAAQRVFLTLCGWRSTLPRVALEAVLLRSQNEKMAVADAVDELERSSFIELIESEADREIFISTPLVAAMFGRRKLAVSPFKSAVEADTEILHQFGAGQRTDVRHGVAPRIEKLVQSIAARAMKNSAALFEYLPMLEFLARHYPPTWLQIASLFEDLDTAPETQERAKDALRHFLEVATDDAAASAWLRLSVLCRVTGDVLGEAHALVEFSEIAQADFGEVSNAANRLNFLLAEKRGALDSEEKTALLRRLARAMNGRVDEADATACSRLAWLYVRLKEPQRAGELVRRGLQLESANEYCHRLAESLARHARNDS